MGASHIQSPEVGRCYLIRRKIGGVASVRFQPAKVLDRRWIQDPIPLGLYYSGNYLKLQWLLDDQIQDHVLETFGSVKELAPRWVKAEYARALEEQVAMNLRVQNLQRLKEQFAADPETMVSSKS